MPLDWMLGLLGGVMIGGAAALFLLGTGRIMGASGLIGGLVDQSGSDKGTTVAFLVGLIGAPALLALAGWRVDTGATPVLWLLIAGGLCVGVGTRLANGCTSGHGVCGMSRVSVRGFVATALYMGAGVATVTTLRIGFGL